ncbi:MAG: DUF4032 domain-containing protein [Anaerolineales bacterium]
MTQWNHPGDSSSRAREDFSRAQRGARLRRLWANLTGQHIGLVPYEEVKRSLRFTSQRYRGLQAVPVDKIIGSLGRSQDFDRAFVPTQTHSRSKWLSVDSAMLSGVPLPAVSLYKVGDAYFVVDGHHRVSVSRQKGSKYIDAEVIEVESRVPVTADLTLDDLDLLGAYREFLEETGLDRLRPDQDVRLTMPGDYTRLIEHIRTHKYFYEKELGHEVTWEEAVAHWYDEVYMPVIEALRQENILRDFPGHTEADLYLWIIEHAYYMRQETGQSISAWEVARDYARRFGRAQGSLWRRLRRRIVDLLVPSRLEPGPPAGTWRAERLQETAPAVLFRDILVTLTGAETGWLALSQAAEIARLEGSVLRGLHVITEDTPEARERGQRIIDEFTFRCQGLNVPSSAKLVVGDVAEEIIDRARWADLVVINQRREQGRVAERPLGTIFQAVAIRAARPILAVPGIKSNCLRRVMLAYDGSPEAHEGLHVLCHMLTKWGVSGVVLTVGTAAVAQDALEEAVEFVKNSCGQEVTARFETGPVPETILRVVEEENVDLLIMGSYRHPPLLKAVLGSMVDRVLREADFPVLISR